MSLIHSSLIALPNRRQGDGVGGSPWKRLQKGPGNVKCVSELQVGGDRNAERLSVREWDQTTVTGLSEHLPPGASPVPASLSPQSSLPTPSPSEATPSTDSSTGPRRVQQPGPSSPRLSLCRGPLLRVSRAHREALMCWCRRWSVQEAPLGAEEKRKGETGSENGLW